MENVTDFDKKGEVTEASIHLLVDTFYAKIRVDPFLGPIFIKAFGDAQEVWGSHLQKMYLFWSSIMLSSGLYHGNPLKKHKELPPFDPSFFERWLKLFAETAYEIHTDEIAKLYIEKSKRIANSLHLGLHYNAGTNSPFLLSKTNL